MTPAPPSASPPSPLAHAKTDEEVLATWDTMALLRPHLGRGAYLAAVRRMMASGYRLAVAAEAGAVLAVAGYRIVETLYGGRTLVVDDLVTAAASRSAGHGGRLLRALREHAAREGCTQVHLDSGVQRTRAHRFYIREGFSVVGLHFVADTRMPETCSTERDSQADSASGRQ